MALAGNNGYYTIDGERYARVSTILGVIRKRGLETWRGAVGNAEADRVSKVATEFGTLVHACCEQVARAWPEPADLPADTPDDALAMADGLADWLTGHVQTVVECERLVVSRRWRYAGTADLLAVLRDGSLAVLDFKTSKQLSEDYAAQLAAYRLALREEGVPVVRRLVIHLPKQEPGTVRTAEYADHQGDEWAFLHALGLYQWLQRQPKNGRR